MASNGKQTSSSAKPLPGDPLERLRLFRQRPDRARGLGDDLAIEMRAMRKISAGEQAARDAWSTVVPDAIGDCTQVGGLRAGKLIVLVPSSAHRHVVDRWLGSGGLHALQGLARVPIGAVVLKIAPKSEAKG